MTAHLALGEFLGHVTRSRRVGGLLLTETRYAPHTRLPRHAHTNAYFCFVRRGAFTETYGSRTRACGPMTVAFHPPGEEHSEEFHEQEGWSFNVEVATTWRQHLGEVWRVFERPSDFQGGELAFLAARLFRELGQADAASAVAIEGLVLEIVAEAARRAAPRTQRKAPDWLKRVRDYLHDHLTESVSLADLAATAGVHPVYLAGSFRRWYRYPVGDYLRRLRVEHACRQMANPQLSLAAIALQAGFADQSHFHRTFKRQLGMTPAVYRKLVAT